MKLKALIFGLVLFGMGACTQRTCPTYAKADVQQQEVSTENEKAEKV